MRCFRKNKKIHQATLLCDTAETQSWQGAALGLQSEQIEDAHIYTTWGSDGDPVPSLTLCELFMTNGPTDMFQNYLEKIQLARFITVKNVLSFFYKVTVSGNYTLDMNATE